MKSTSRALSTSLPSSSGYCPNSANVRDRACPGHRYSSCPPTKVSKHYPIDTHTADGTKIDVSMFRTNNRKAQQYRPTRRLHRRRRRDPTARPLRRDRLLDAAGSPRATERSTLRRHRRRRTPCCAGAGRPAFATAAGCDRSLVVVRTEGKGAGGTITAGLRGPSATKNGGGGRGEAGGGAFPVGE